MWNNKNDSSILNMLIWAVLQILSKKIIKFETAVKKVKNSDAYLGRYGVAKQLTGPLVSLGFQMVLTLKSRIEANLIYNRKTYL